MYLISVFVHIAVLSNWSQKSCHRLSKISFAVALSTVPYAISRLDYAMISIGDNRTITSKACIEVVFILIAVSVLPSSIVELCTYEIIDWDTDTRSLPFSSRSPPNLGIILSKFCRNSGIFFCRPSNVCIHLQFLVVNS